MSGAHWRKAWPEGVDNGDDDESVLDFGTTRRRSSENPWNPDPTYPWSYDEEVFDTQQSLNAAEKITGSSLSFDGVKAYRGKNWIHYPKVRKNDRLAEPPSK